MFNVNYSNRIFVYLSNILTHEWTFNDTVKIKLDTGPGRK